MTDSTLNAMQAAERSIRFGVLPALADSPDPLALEQAGLVASFLDFMKQRNDRIYERSRAEMSLAIALASQILDRFSQHGSDDTALREALVSAEAVYGHLGAAPHQMDEATRLVNTVISRIVRDSSSLDPDLRSVIASDVTSVSRKWIALQRAWFLPQGWEWDEKSVPDLDSALANCMTNYRT